MAFADETRPISGRPQQFDKGNMVGGKGHAVEPDPGIGRHSPGHERCPIRHADRTGGVETVKGQSRFRQAINIWRAHNRIAIAPQMIALVLIGNDEQEIRSI